MNRRKFVIGALTAAAVGPSLSASSGIGRSRISAISDEIADSPEGALAFAKQYRLQWLELRNVPGQKSNYFFMEPAELKPHARSFADAGIRISFLNTNLLKFALPGTEPAGAHPEASEVRASRLAREQAMFDRRMEDVRKCLASAKILGCENVRVFAFLRTADPMALLPRVAEILNPMVKMAREEGVRLLVENENSCNVGKCVESAALLKLLPSPSFGTNWDAMNGAALDERPYPDGYALLPKDRIYNCQIKGKTILDTPAHLDWGAIIAALSRDGYQGELGLETHYSHGPDNIQRSHESMEAILRTVDAAC